MSAQKTIKNFSPKFLKTLMLSLAAFALANPLWAQEIKGRITDIDGFGLEAVTLILSHPNGTKDTVQTDYNGDFTIGATSTTTGIEEITNSKKLYYRFSGNALYLKYDAPINQGFVYELSGKTNTRFNLHNASEGTIQLKDAPQAIYLLKINTSEGIKTAKILKTNNYAPIQQTSTSKTSLRHHKSTKDNGVHTLTVQAGDYKTQNRTLENLDQGQTYDNEDFSLHHTDKQFNQFIKSENENGEAIDVTYEIKNTGNNEILMTGNTGTNGLDTLQLIKEYAANTDLEVSIYTSSTNPEIEPATQIKIWQQENLQENLTTNYTKKYDFSLSLSAKDAETDNQLIGFSSIIYLDGDSITSGSSTSNTVLNLAVNQLSNNTPIQVISGKEDFANDTLNILLNKTAANQDTTISLNPIFYKYALNISAKDAETGNLLSNFTNLIIDENGNEIASGQSGTNTWTNLNLSLRTNSLIKIITTKTGYLNDTVTKTLTKADLSPEYSLTITETQYRFNMKFTARHNITNAALDSISIWVNNSKGEQIAAATSGINTNLNLLVDEKNNTGLEIIWARNGFANDTTFATLTTANLNPEYETILDSLFWEVIIWHVGIDELSQSGTTFDVKITAPNYTKTFTTNNAEPWRDTIPTEQGVAVNATIEYTPHVQQGSIPLYPKTINLTIPEGETNIGRDTLYALEQNVKYIMNIYDFENQAARKEANITIHDLKGNLTFQGTTTNGQIETNYLPVGDEGEGFEGMMTITPIDNTYFGTKVVFDAGDWSIENDNDIWNNLGTPYKGYKTTMPIIQTDFSRTKEAAIYLVKKQRKDPLTGEMLDMIPAEISELEGNEINTELARYGEENIYFEETDSAGYYDFREHIQKIFGYTFKENEVGTSRTTATIKDYTVNNDNHKDELGWNIRFGNNSTGIDGVGPLLFGKADICAQGTLSIDLTDWAGCAREYGRKTGMGTVWTRDSYMSTSTPANFPDDLNIKDRVYTNLILEYKETQVKQEESERNIANAGYFFAP